MCNGYNSLFNCTIFLWNQIISAVNINMIGIQMWDNKRPSAFCQVFGIFKKNFLNLKNKAPRPFNNSIT